MSFWDTHKVTDGDFVQSFRKHLANQGAVAYFDQPSAADQAANHATMGLPPGMPGSGLYRVGEGLYEAHVQAEGHETDYAQFSAEDWRHYLLSREPKATYIVHYERRGDVPFSWRHIVVKFRIEATP